MLDKAQIITRRTLILGLLFFAAPAIAQDISPAESAKLAVRESLRLLETGDTTKFMQTYLPPRVIQRLTSKRPLTEVVAEFEKQQVPNLLAALRSVTAVQPVMSADGLRAQFALPKDVDGRTHLTFQKEGKSWYLF